LSRMAGGIRYFWQRISDGIAIQQLWEQFRAEAVAGYRLYSKEVESGLSEGGSRRKGFWRVARGLFWAMMMKLSPARRVLLLIALVIVFMPRIHIDRENFHFDTSGPDLFWVVSILLVLLALELADRVTMKRDLEIAREIQNWLMPSEPPEVSGVDIAFTTRPANTVAGDYYDAFFRPNDRLLIVVADVAGKSVPAALLTATLQASLRTLAALPGSLAELVDRVNHYACEQSCKERGLLPRSWPNWSPLAVASHMSMRATIGPSCGAHRAPSSGWKPADCRWASARRGLIIRVLRRSHPAISCSSLRTVLLKPKTARRWSTVKSACCP
jgi:hypothetical protein